MHRETLEIDAAKLVRHVKERSCRPDIEDKHLFDGLAYMQKRCGDPFQVARGHGVVDCLSFALRSAIGSCTKAQANREAIETLLRVAYNIAEFSRTKLYDAVNDWERRNSPYEVFIKTISVR